MPNCQVAEYRAISRGSPPSGAISGGIDRIAGRPNARTVPNRAASPKIGTALVGDVVA